MVLHILFQPSTNLTKKRTCIIIIISPNLQMNRLSLREVPWIAWHQKSTWVVWPKQREPFTLLNSWRRRKLQSYDPGREFWINLFSWGKTKLCIFTGRDSTFSLTEFEDQSCRDRTVMFVTSKWTNAKWCVYMMTYYSTITKKWSSGTCHRDEPWEQDAKWKEPVAEGCKWYDSTYMKYPE